MEKLSQSQVATENTLINEISQIVSKIIPDKRTDKNKTRSALVADVKEISMTTPSNKKIGVLVVYLPYALALNNASKISKIVNEIQTKKNKHAFVVSQRTTINNRSDYKQKIPKSRTLTSVYDALLEDLIAPGYIVGKRTCIRLDGSTYNKIFVNEETKAFLEERTEIIEKIYYSLTNRKIKIEFRAEANYAVLPVRRVRKDTAGKRKTTKKQAPKTN